MKQYDFLQAVKDSTDTHRTIPFWSWNGALKQKN